MNTPPPSDNSLDTLQDNSLGLRLQIHRTGAELVSLQKRAADGSWHGFLYRDGDISAPPSGWANHATVMGYYVHRLWQEQSRYGDHLIRGGNHGFLRHFVFDPPRRKGNALTYTVPSDRIPPESYPLRIRLELTYRLGSGGLEIVFHFFNEESTEARLSFGLHPGFAVSSPGNARVVAPPGLYRRLIAPGNFLNGEILPLEHAGGPLPIAVEKLPDSYLFDLSGVPNRQFVLEDPVAGRRIRLDFSEVPYMTLWSDLHNFLCVEPCWGMPDSNPPRPFPDKLGIQSIPPNGEISCGFRMKPEFMNG